ncbi:ankyrin [Xylaria venustula]|nr:ankyrin [Xylaria venustula]
MNLFGLPFELPFELVQLIFEQIVNSRHFHRVMRIRFVSRQFKTHVDNSIFRTRLLSQLIDTPYGLGRFSWHCHHRHRQFIVYVELYIMYQVQRDTSSTSPLSRISRVAQELCEDDRNSETEAVLACTNSLVRLAMYSNIRGLLEPSTECSDEERKADRYVASVYLGRYSYVERLIANGIEFCAVPCSSDVRCTVFGTAFRAANLQGDVDMIKLLLSCNSEYRDTGVLLRSEQKNILHYASSYGHQAAFDFALDMRPIDLPDTSRDYGAMHPFGMLQRAIWQTPIPRNYERVSAILKPYQKGLTSFTTSWLQHRASHGQLEMVLYLLDKGVNPNYTSHTYRISPLRSAVAVDDESIIKILLDAGADPNLPGPLESPFVYAAWVANLSVIKLLLPRVTNIDEGIPPPIVLAVFKERMDLFRLLRKDGARLDTPETGEWAMTVAKRYGLSSMIEVLVKEGVSQDAVFQLTSLSEFPWRFRAVKPPD